MSKMNKTHVLPLDSASATLAYLEHLACPNGVTTGEDCDALKSEYAKAIGMKTWDKIEEFSRLACRILDRNTIQFRRKLVVPREVAARYIFDTVLIEKWMFPIAWDLREGGRFTSAWNGYIEELRLGWLIKLRADEGGSSTLELVESIRGTEFVVTDYLPPAFVVPEHVRTDGKTIDSHQPLGPGTHWHGVIAGWHCGTNSFAKVVQGLESNDDYEVLNGLYRKLLHARSRSEI